MKKYDAIVIGGGPCGLSAAIEMQDRGMDVLTIERGNVVHSIYNYPTHQTFFSSSLKLSIGDIPFITAKEKPKRRDALVYYRTVVDLKELNLHTYEEVQAVEKQEDDSFIVTTDQAKYGATYVVAATGYYANPNRLDAKGADLPHVHHYFKEAHPYYGLDVVIIGGRNSAIDAAIELAHAGARVSVVYRGSQYSESIKPWVLPGFESLVRHGKAKMFFNSNVEEITEDEVIIDQQGTKHTLKASTVFAMIGYHPDHEFLRSIGIEIDEETGSPVHHPETMETNVDGLFIAGVIAAGNDANSIFIENGRFHGCQIAQTIANEVEK